MTLKIGATLRDKVSGFTGIAHSKVEFMTGNVQFVLQPPAKDGVLPDTIGFDAHQLEEAPGATVPAVAPPADTGITLGEKVKDIVSGVGGIAIRRNTFLNGCVYYVLQETEPNKDGIIVEHFLEWKRLERVSAGVTAKIAKKVEPVTPKTPRAPGGPSTRRIPMRG